MKATLLLLLSISTAVFAAEADFLRCRGISDANARLACYDAVAPAVDSRDARSTAGRPVVQAETRAPVAAQSASVRPASQPTTAQTMTDQFGMESRVAPGTLDVLESTIAGRFEGWEAKSNIKLANGQVWQIADDSSRYVTMTDPKIKIRRGALGSFYLEFEKINHSPRVKRVQ